METLLEVSEPDWALAKRRERVLSMLAESKECSRAMMQKACAALQLSRAMVFRLLARYREDRRLSALLLHPRGRKRGSGGLREEQEQIITGQIRKFYLIRKMACSCASPGDRGRLWKEKLSSSVLRHCVATASGLRPAHAGCEARGISARQRAVSPAPHAPNNILALGTGSN